MPSFWFAAVAFVASSGSYLFLSGSLAWTEELAAAMAGLATAGFVTIQRIRQDRPLTLPAPPLRLLWHTSSSLVTDTLHVGAALLSARPRGEASWQAFHPDGRSPREAGRRALVTLLTSMAPNGFVLDLRPSALPEADHGLLLHRLVPAQPLSDPDWPA